MGSLQTSLVVLLATGALLTGGAFLLRAVAPVQNPSFRHLGRPLNDYLVALESEEADLRETALTALRKLGPEDAAAVPQITERLDALSKEVRVQVIGILGQIGKAALPDLEAELYHPDPKKGIAALEALSRSGQEAVPVIVQALCDDRASVRESAARLLAGLGKDAARAVPTLLSLLRLEKNERRDGDRTFCRLASEALVGIGEPAAASVLEALRDRTATSQLQLELLSVLERMGSKTALPDLVVLVRKNLEALDTQSEDATEESAELALIQAAFRALGELGPEAGRELAAFLDANIPQVRQACLRQLSSMEEVPVGALRPLLSALQSEDESLRLLAAQALGKMGQAPRPAVDLLFQRLLDTGAGDEVVQAWSENLEAWPLGDGHSRPGIPSRSLRVSSRRVTSSRSRRTTTSRASRRPDPARVYFHSLVAAGEGAALELADRASSADKKESYLALALLETMGVAAAPARPALLTLVGADDVVVRARAVRALGRCGLHPKATAGILIRSYRREIHTTRPEDVLEDGTPVHSFGAITARALSTLGVQAVPVLIATMEDGDWRLRLLAVSALERDGSDSPPPALVRAVPALVRLLEDDRNLVRLEQPGTPPAEEGSEPPTGLQTKRIWRRAIEVLASLGPAAQSAVDALIQRLEDEDLRDDVVWALGSIGPAAAGSAAPLFDCLVREAREAAASSETHREAAIPRDLMHALVLLQDSALPALVAALRQNDADVRYWALRAFAAVATGNRFEISLLRCQSRRFEPAGGAPRRGRSLPTRSRTTRSRTRTTPVAPTRISSRVGRVSPVGRSRGPTPGRRLPLAEPPKRHSITAWLPELLKASRDRDATNRRLCLSVLRETDLWLPEASPRGVAEIRANLLYLVRTEGEENRAEAVRTLGAMGQEALEAAPTLARLLVAEVRRLEERCALEITRGPGGFFWRDRHPDQEPSDTTLFWALMESLRDLSQSGVSLPLGELATSRAGAGQTIAWCALHLVEQVRPKPAGVLDVVVGCLGQQSTRIRRKAAEVVAAYGPGARDALPALVVQVERESRRLLRAADEASQLEAAVLINAFFQALEKAERAAVPHLKALLSDRSLVVRRRAIRSLVDVRAPATEVGDVLRALARDAEPAIRGYAAWALKRLEKIEIESRLAVTPGDDKTNRGASS